MFISDALASDMTLHGYSLLRLLGKGGAGAVFEARQISTGQTVAIKLLHHDSAEQQNSDASDALRKQRLVARFERETHLCAQLHHPHIVMLLDKGQTSAGNPENSQQLFAVFEYVPGETLKDLLIRNGALSALAAGELMGQVLDALACAHAQGIAHRDLKPQNIMISTTGTRMHVKVLDFGIAAFIPERQKVDYRNLTMTSEMMCSPSYSAPEHLRGEPPTIKTDLYAWGLLFLECLTGRPAIEGITLADIFHQQLNSTEVPLPPALVGHPLAELLRRALRKDPRERAESAAILYQDFQRIHLGNIVGNLSSSRDGSSRHGAQFGDDTAPADFAVTQKNQPGQFGLAYQQQQMSVLSCTLNVKSVAAAALEPEVLEALQRDQLSMCADTAARYGGYLAGSLGNSLLFYFGYPQASDDDARRCARTALELNSQSQRRNALLAAQGCCIDMRSGIHTGMLNVMPGTVPTGVTSHTAMQLERLAASGSILLSDTSRQILGPYVECDSNSQSLEKNDGGRIACFAILGENKAEAAFLLRSGQLSHGMIGRDTELAQLRAAWQTSSSGNGQTRLLQGEAGIGKSRLAYELGVAARQDAAIVLEVRCLPENQNNALQPVLGLLKNHLQLHDVPPHEAVEHLMQTLEQVGVNVAWVLPILCSWLALPIPPEYPAIQFSPERQKALLLDALHSLILSMDQETSGHRPLRLVLIEDLHWIDQTSLELIQRLITSMPEQKCMLLMTARPAFACPWPTVQPLLLSHLSDTASGELVSAVLGGKTIDTSSLRRLCQRSDGIPLFIEELTRMLLSNGMLVERNGVVELDAGFESGNIPVTLRDLLSARLARLGAVRDTAQLAAAIGREFDYALLAEVALCDQATLQTDLEQLIAADLVIRQRRVQGDSFIFRHALIRDAAYDAMPRLMREQTHARIAQQLEGRSEAEIERNLPQLAHHFAHATRFDRAVQYGTRAARVSLERALHDDAIKTVEMVQGWIMRLVADQQALAEIGLSRILTNALMSKYGWGDARVKDSAEHALQLIEGIGDPQLTVPILWAVIIYHHVASNRKIVRPLMRQLFTLVEKTGDQSLSVACRTMHGNVAWIDGEYQQAAQSFNQVMHEYDPLAYADHGYAFGMDSRIWALTSLSSVHWFTTDDDEAAWAQAKEAVALARQLNHIPSLGVALIQLTFLHHYQGDREGALAITTQILELAQKYGLPALDAYGSILHSWATDNVILADQVLAGLKQIGCMLGHTYYASLAAEIEARAGKHEAALARIEACLAMCEHIDEPYYKPELLLRRAMYRAKAQSIDHPANRADLQQAILLAQAAGMQRTVKQATAQLKVLS